MACFTASFLKLHQHQPYILVIIMDAKVNKNFKSQEKNIRNLIFILILNKLLTQSPLFCVIHKPWRPTV